MSAARDSLSRLDFPRIFKPKATLSNTVRCGTGRRPGTPSPYLVLLAGTELMSRPSTSTAPELASSSPARILQRRGLAAARWPEQRHQLPRLDGQAQPVERVDVARSAGEVTKFNPHTGTATHA